MIPPVKSTADLTDLSKRASACTQISPASGEPRWRLLHGMMVLSDRLKARGTVISSVGLVMICDEDGEIGEYDPAEWRPEFKDPLTACALPFLVRRAWGDQHLNSRWSGNSWCIVDGDQVILDIRTIEATELESWIACLEIAPISEVKGA